MSNITYAGIRFAFAFLFIVASISARGADFGSPGSSGTEILSVMIEPLNIDGSVFEDPIIDFAITFSAPVDGFLTNHVQVGGDAGPTHFTLTSLDGGANYRFRLTGFSQAGSLSVQIPAGVVTGIAPAEVNDASDLVSLTYAPPIPDDDLAALSDEFDDHCSSDSWLRNDATEGWGADKLEVWDINDSVAGHMRLMPYSSSWYQDFAGVHVYREVTGDFVVTIRLDVFNRAGTGRPNSDFSLAGILIRSPRGVVAAAPVPDPGPGTVLPWPPPAFEQPNHYVTDWSPGTENYIFLSYGFGSAGLTQPDGNNPNRWHYEVKTTINSVSTLYPRTHGVPENEPNATLQIVRRGGTFLLLRRHGDGPWIIENRFERPDMPATLNVGITTYTDWETIAAGWNFVSAVEPYHQNRIVNVGVGTPDLIADVDYVRFRRPDPDLELADLQAVDVTGEGAWNGIVYLTNTVVAPYLGDHAAAYIEPPGITYYQWLAQHLTTDQLADPELTDPAHDLGNDEYPSIFSFLTKACVPWREGSDPSWSEGDNYLAPPGGGDSNTYGQIYVPRNPSARGWQFIVDATTNVLQSWTVVATSDDGAPATGVGVTGELPGNPPYMVIRPPPDQEDAPAIFFRSRAVPLP